MAVLPKANPRAAVDLPESRAHDRIAPVASNLQCSRCGAGNRAGRQFCAQCGARLPLACSACGFENEAGEKFCGGCGAALGAKPAPPPMIDTSAETSAEAPHGGMRVGATADAERRPVTVLFADLVDYTRMSRALDPEDVHAMLERYYAIADEIVERFGGSIDKHIGDSVMAVFGAPIAHDDDAVRAVRAAAEIHRAMPTVGGAMGQVLAVHVGIASGEVVASGLGSNRHRAYTVIGNSVNLAARLLKLAGTSETVLDEAVHAAVQRVARCTPIEDARVKGIDAPLTAWRFVEFVDSGERARTQPFVGRAAELAQLGAALASCAAGGTGCTLLVRGDAGIGKSRLVGELRSRAIASGFACHTALVLDFGMAKGREAVREIAMSLMQLSPESNEEARHEALRRLLARHPDLVTDEPFLRDIAGIPQAEGGNALYEAMDNAARQQGRAAAVVRLLAIGCTRSPILLVIEDVHWADKVTLDAIAALTRAVGGLPAILALTSRVAGDPLTAAWRASVQGSPLLTIDLGPLGAKEAIELAGGIFTAPTEFVRKCVERSGGNPLFLEQLMRAADEQGDALPASLSSLVLARMDRLPEPDRAALRAAAVIGQRFPLALVRELTQMPHYSCDVLMAHFLVLPVGDEYLFAHALIRDGVYASLTRTRRAELHRAAAQWYGARDPALVAEHLDRADAPEAARAYLDAALAQAAALQPERALTLAERGATLARAPEDVVALNMLLGRLHWESGKGQPAIDAYQAALAATRQDVERCRALIGIASGHRLLGGSEPALAALAEAEPLSRGSPRESCELHYIRGNLAFAQGNNAMCHAEHQTALRFAASLGDPLWEVNATSGLGDADYAEGRMLTALARFRRCVEVCDAHGLPRPASANLAMAGFCRFFALEFDEGIADIEAARALAVKLGNRYAEMFTLEGQGSLLTFCHRYAEARPFIERGLELASAIGAKRYEATLLTELAEVDFAGGDAVAAREHVDRALAVFRELGMGFWGPTALGLRARLQDDERERARDRAEAEAILAAGCLSHNHIGYHRSGIEDALERGEWTRALAHAAALESYTAAEPLPYCDFLVARARTLVGLVAKPEDVALQRDLARLEEKAHALRWPIGWSVASAANSRSAA
jgi:class 3 adenylate cyclase/tetratricopeptide (TPR) repeat protein